jgi:acyl-coenzyme A synthetase/AMP-(fatty) acid ligase
VDLDGSTPQRVGEAHGAILLCQSPPFPAPTLRAEQVAAAVVLRPGWAWHEELGSSLTANTGTNGQREVTPADLQQHCRAAGLTAFKLPRRVAAFAELPRNSSGKVVKAAVKDALLTRHPRSAL